MGNFISKSQKPFVVYTKDGDYFFQTKEEAQAFAVERNGFFDKSTNKYFAELRRSRLKEVI